MLTALKILSVPQNCPEVDRIQKQARQELKEHNNKKGYLHGTARQCGCCIRQIEAGSDWR